MSIFIAIAGLAFLILVHEAGHFFTALLVGMRPRSFNLGFGPPLAKVRRRGIEYAVRILPLGGYVKIPGMHRPAPSDLDVQFGRVLHQSPGLVGPVARGKRALRLDDFEAARAAADDIENAARAAGVEPLAARGVNELRDGLSPDAY